MRTVASWESLAVAGVTVHRDWLLVNSIFLGILMYCVFFFIHVSIHGKPQAETPKLESMDVRVSTDLSDADVRAVFGESVMLSRVAAFTWRSGRAVANLLYLSYNAFKTGKTLNTQRAWNLECKIVAYGEGVFALAFFFTILTNLIRPSKEVGVNQGRLNVRGALSALANFSILKCIPLVNPAKAMEVMSKLQATRYGPGFFLYAAAACYLILIMLPLALMAVLVKVSQLHFITQAVQWTPWDYFAFAFFINALAGIPGNVDHDRISAMFRLINAAEAETFERRYMLKVAEQLADSYGDWIGIVMLITMSPTDVCQLLNKGNRTQPLPEPTD
ncbi:unnamed protein product [Symbiodinium sp. CCMP2456]|nr:unnamed protein product [Symbiodinium sp. CCMP2456]